MTRHVLFVGGPEDGKRLARADHHPPYLEVISRRPTWYAPLGPALTEKVGVIRYTERPLSLPTGKSTPPLRVYLMVPEEMSEAAAFSRLLQHYSPPESD